MGASAGRGGANQLFVAEHPHRRPNLEGSRLCESIASRNPGVRRIENSLAWIDHRLGRNGYLPVTTHQDQALYLFLILAADRHGVSFYRKGKTCDAVGLDWSEFEVARDRSFKLAASPFRPAFVSRSCFPFVAHFPSPFRFRIRACSGTDAGAL